MDPRLAPLKPGERSDFTFAEDHCITAEQMVEHYLPGQCDGNTDLMTIFNEKLAVLKCGIITRQKDLETFQSGDPGLLQDVETVMEIGRHFHSLYWVAAASSRYVPVLLENPEKKTETVAALSSSLSMVAPIKIEDADWRRHFINGRDHDESENLVPLAKELSEVEFFTQREKQENSLLAPFDHLKMGCPNFLTSVLIDENEFKKDVNRANDLFSSFKDVRVVIPGVSKPDCYDFYDTPVFMVGLTKNGRIAGLVAEHVN